MLKRPTTIEGVLKRLANFRSPEATVASKQFVAQPTDLFISTYSKSGTTWMQQVVHQLRTGGDAAFEEISSVVPWLESAVDMDIDPGMPQTGGFRAFKCHLMYCDIPKGGRYITVFRDPATVLISFYRFFEGWWFEPGSITLDDFARELFIKDVP